MNPKAFGTRLLAILVLIISTGTFSSAEETTSNPIITHFEWGKVVVNFAHLQSTFKDCKLSPKGAQAWNWKEFNTQHVPGIQIKDLQSIINESDIVILSRGVDLVLQVKPETLDYLKQVGKEVYVLQSEEAVKLYNQLASQNKKVGMLLHSTC